MGPSDKAVLAAIKFEVQNLFRGLDRNELTVNNVRSHVEAELQLDPGFLKNGSWKHKSKEYVKAEYDRLLELDEAAGEPHSNQSTPAKVKISKKSKPDAFRKPAKRASDGDKGQPRKRHKKQETPVSEQGDSELTSIEDTPEDSEDSYASEVPKDKKQRATPKAPTKSTPKQPQKSKVDANEKRAKQRPKGSTKVAQSNKEKRPASKVDLDDNDSDLSDVETPDLDLDNNGKAVDADGSDSDMSVVFDEPPKQKKQSKPTSFTKSSKNPRIVKASVDISPDEVEIKTLQTQLTKCGIRKIWGVVLKTYGTDLKAKIKHLKGMLKDAGMEGRFSEARAREIKEARELMADLEAVKEGEASWGMGRESRNKKTREKKATSHSYSHGVDGDMEARSRSISEEPEPRIARAKLDLAFLGDESDSDD